MQFDSPIAQTLVRQFEACPERVAVRENGQTTTVRQIFEQARTLAENLRARGFHPGDRAVIAAPPGADFIKITYALVFLGGTVAIIDPEMGRDNYASKLRQFAPRWAFVDARLLLLQEHPVLRWLYLRRSAAAPYFPFVRGLKIVAVGRWLPLLRMPVFLGKLLSPGKIKGEKLLAGMPTTASIGIVKSGTPPSEGTENFGPEKTPGFPTAQKIPNPKSEFLITYTSGTLAEPKGVVHTEAGIAESIQLIANQLDTRCETLLATYGPHYMLIALAAGIGSVLYDPKRFSAAEKMRFFEAEGVTTAMGPPADFLPMVEHCEQNGDRLPGCLRHVLLGSAPVTRRFLERLTSVAPEQLRVTCLYGMTENLLVATVDAAKTRPRRAGDLLGPPAPGVEVQIVEDEIFIKSRQLFARYFNRPGRDEWHPTGDLGSLSPDGDLLLLGRKKDMIIRRNLNIYPALYESTVNRIPGVTEAVLVGVYDEKRADERVFLVVEGETGLTAAGLMEKLRSGPFSIDAEALPDEVVFRTLPRSGRQHKVDKKVLREAFKIANP